jgi:hypothetical protein
MLLCCRHEIVCFQYVTLGGTTPSGESVPNTRIFTSFELRKTQNAHVPPPDCPSDPLWSSMHRLIGDHSRKVGTDYEQRYESTVPGVCHKQREGSVKVCVIASQPPGTGTYPAHPSSTTVSRSTVSFLSVSLSLSCLCIHLVAISSRL